MTLSLIVCTRNRGPVLKETLAALTGVLVPNGMTAELLVVDNGSTDDTRQIVNSVNCPTFLVRYIFEVQRGQARARNAGLKVASGDVIVFTDDDVRPDPQWLIKITAPIVQGRFDALAGRITIAPHLMRPWMTKTHLALLSSTRCLSVSGPESAVGANMAFTRRVLQKVPCFDPELGPGRLGFWDDTLFTSQLKRAGYTLGMAVDAVVEHHFDASRLSRMWFLNRARGEGRSSAYVSWHWRHEQIAQAAILAQRYQCELVLKRVLRWRDWHQTEGIALWEWHLLVGIAFNRHYLLERRRPHAYELLGTRKLQD